MANTVAYTFRLNDQFTRASRTIGVSGDRLRRKMDGISKGFRAAKGAALGAAAGVAAVGFGLVKAGKAGAIFETGMADLSAITKTTGADLAFAGDEALRLGEKWRVNAEDVLVVMKRVGSKMQSIAKDPTAVANITDTILKLSKATGVDLAQSADIATTAFNVFPKGIEKADEFVNVLAASAQVGAAEMDVLGQALVKVGPVAVKLAKLGFAEVNTALQVLAKGGIESQIAGTKLTRILINMEKSGFDAIRPSVVGFAEAFEALVPFLGDTVKMTQLFGAEAIDAGLILASDVETYREWLPLIKGTNEAQRQAAVRMGTVSDRMFGIWTVMRNKLIRAFIDNKTQIDATVDSLGKWVNSIKGQDIEKFTRDMFDLAAAFAAVAREIGTAVGGVLDLARLAGIGQESGSNTLRTLLAAGAGRAPPPGFFSELLGGGGAPAATFGPLPGQGGGFAHIDSFLQAMAAADARPISLARNTEALDRVAVSSAALTREIDTAGGVLARARLAGVGQESRSNALSTLPAAGGAAPSAFHPERLGGDGVPDVTGGQLPAPNGGFARIDSFLQIQAAPDVVQSLKTRTTGDIPLRSGMNVVEALP